jgi:hypothetical protein
MEKFKINRLAICEAEREGKKQKTKNKKKDEPNKAAQVIEKKAQL